MWIIPVKMMQRLLIHVNKVLDTLINITVEVLNSLIVLTSDRILTYTHAGGVPILIMLANME